MYSASTVGMKWQIKSPAAMIISAHLLHHRRRSIPTPFYNSYVVSYDQHSPGRFTRRTLTILT